MPVLEAELKSGMAVLGADHMESTEVRKETEFRNMDMLVERSFVVE